MNEQDYLEQRVQDQISWYEARSASAQLWFKRLRSAEIVAAALIPLLAGYSAQSPAATATIGFLGALVAVIAGLLGLYQHQERWLNYRSTAEALKREKFLFLTRSTPYHEGEPFPRFVQNVESLMGQENTGWAKSSKAAAEGGATAPESP